MLKTRIITALVILPIVLVALFAFPDWAWGVFTLGIVLTACWEWGRMSMLTPPWNAAYLALSAMLAGLVYGAYVQGNVAGIGFELLERAAFMTSGMFWLLAVPLWLYWSWRPHAKAWVAAAGWLVIFPTWFAFLALREISPWLLLTFAAIVWVADIAAYFIGRRFGRHKLAPAISPGKTVEGAVGGVIGAALFFFVWQFLVAGYAPRAIMWERVQSSHYWHLLVLFVFLAVMSVIGDLFESWMKRGAGLKDSSNLLPGHGGILDRIDALTSTLPLAGLYTMLTPGVWRS